MGVQFLPGAGARGGGRVPHRTDEQALGWLQWSAGVQLGPSRSESSYPEGWLLTWGLGLCLLAQASLYP